jgi:regulator of nucleoside diphosphate kinase
MFRPDTIHLRRSDADTLERLIESTGPGRDGGSLALLDEELARATIVPDDALPHDAVALDSQVVFCDLQSGERREVTLVVPSKADTEHHCISVLSPVGSALIGLHIGDTIDWPMPGGRVRRLQVLEVTSLKAVA